MGLDNLNITYLGSNEGNPQVHHALFPEDLGMLVWWMYVFQIVELTEYVGGDHCPHFPARLWRHMLQKFLANPGDFDPVGARFFTSANPCADCSSFALNLIQLLRARSQNDLPL